MVSTTGNHLVNGCLTLPIPPGTTLKGELTVLFSPRLEPRQLWTEQRSGVKVTGHEVISFPCLGPCLPKLVRKHPKLRGNRSRKSVYTADQSSANLAKLGVSIPLLRLIWLWGALLSGNTAFAGALCNDVEKP